MIIITCLAFENQSVFSLYYYVYIIIMQNENEITFCMKEALCTTRRFYSKVKSILIVYRDVKDFVYFILTWQVQYKKHKKVRCWIKVVSSCNGYFDLGKCKLNPRLKTVYYDQINPIEIYLLSRTYLKLIFRVFQYYSNIYSFVSATIQSLKNIKCPSWCSFMVFRVFFFFCLAANTNWKHKHRRNCIGTLLKRCR